MFDRISLQAGMKVRAPGGRRLGTVFVLGEGAFVLRRGPGHRYTYAVPFEEIATVKGGDIYLTRGIKALGPRLADPHGIPGPLTRVVPLRPESQLAPLA